MLGLTRAFGRLNVRPAGIINPTRDLSARLCRQMHSSTVASAKSDDSEKSGVMAANQSASSAFDIAESETKIKEDYKTVSAGKGLGSMLIREYRYSTANFHVSPSKLRLIANQISGLTVTEAIRQMEFSAKKASDRIKHSLVWARKNAIYQKQMNPDNMFIKEARVGKGQFRKRLDPKARGRFGVIRIPYSHMKYVFWEKQADAKPIPRNAAEKALLVGKLKRRKIKGFRLTRNVWTPLKENKPVLGPSPHYNW